MRVLVIGGAGYVGSALCKKLEKSHRVTSIDTGWFGNINVFNPSDYRDLSVSELAVYDAVVLLAGHSSVKMCEMDPQSAYNNNVRNFLELTTKLSHQKFIYASSASIYGNSSSGKFSEGNIDLSPVNYYDMTKLHADHIAKLSGLNYYGLRFGTVNGQSPNLRTDVMINAMVHSAKQQGQINVFNGATRRSILGIKDLCRAVDTILNEGRNFPGVYNLASFDGTPQSIGYRVAELLNVPVIDHDAGNPKTAAYSFELDTTKFQTTFGFTFKESIDSVTTGLLKSYDTCLKSTRNKLIHYP